MNEVGDTVEHVRKMHAVWPEVILGKDLLLGGWPTVRIRGKFTTQRMPTLPAEGVFNNLRQGARRPYVMRGQTTKKELV